MQLVPGGLRRRHTHQPYYGELVRARAHKHGPGSTQRTRADMGAAGCRADTRPPRPAVSRSADRARGASAAQTPSMPAAHGPAGSEGLKPSASAPPPLGTPPDGHATRPRPDPPQRELQAHWANPSILIKTAPADWDRAARGHGGPRSAKVHSSLFGHRVPCLRPMTRGIWSGGAPYALHRPPNRPSTMERAHDPSSTSARPVRLRRGWVGLEINDVPRLFFFFPLSKRARPSLRLAHKEMGTSTPTSARSVL